MKIKIFTLIAMLLPMMASAFETDNSNVNGTRGVGDVNIGVVLHNVSSEDIYITGHIYIAVSTPTQDDWGPINVDLDPVSDGCAMYRIPAGQTAAIPSNQINYSVNSKDPNEVVSKYLGGFIYDWIYCRAYSWTDAHDPAVIRTECLSSSFQNGGYLEFNLVGIKHDEGIITPCPNAITLGENTTPDVPEVKLNESNVTIQKGKTVTLKAIVSPSTTDESLTWESSNTKVATVTSGGKVKGVKTGIATITCTSNSTGAKATCEVTVGYVKLDKKEALINKGKTVTLTATVYPSKLEDKSVTWESSNTKIATVTTAGKVKGVKAGTATITCTSNATGLKATFTVTVVKSAVTLNKTETYVQKGKTLTLKATVTPETLADKSVTWESSDTKIVTVTSEGKVKGVKYGTATITCTSVATGVKATCQVTVGKVIISMSEFSLKRSRETILIPILYPTDLADKSVTWESSDTSIATVNEEGRVKGIKAGTATITCTSVATGLKGTCTVTVLSTSGARSMIGDDDELTGLKELESPAVAEPFDVYDQNGRKVLHQVTSLDGLPDGIYIVNGKKILKKK